MEHNNSLTKVTMPQVFNKYILVLKHCSSIIFHFLFGSWGEITTLETLLLLGNIHNNYNELMIVKLGDKTFTIENGPKIPNTVWLFECACSCVQHLPLVWALCWWSSGVSKHAAPSTILLCSNSSRHCYCKGNRKTKCQNTSL